MRDLGAPFPRNLVLCVVLIGWCAGASGQEAIKPRRTAVRDLRDAPMEEVLAALRREKATPATTHLLSLYGRGPITERPGSVGLFPYEMRGVLIGITEQQLKAARPNAVLAVDMSHALGTPGMLFPTEYTEVLEPDASVRYRFYRNRLVEVTTTSRGPEDQFNEFLVRIAGRFRNLPGIALLSDLNPNEFPGMAMVWEESDLVLEIIVSKLWGGSTERPSFRTKVVDVRYRDLDFPPAYRLVTPERVILAENAAIYLPNFPRFLCDPREDWRIWDLRNQSIENILAYYEGSGGLWAQHRAALYRRDSLARRDELARLLPGDFGVLTIGMTEDDFRQARPAATVDADLKRCLGNLAILRPKLYAEVFPGTATAHFRLYKDRLCEVMIVMPNGYGEKDLFAFLASFVRKLGLPSERMLLAAEPGRFSGAAVVWRANDLVAEIISAWRWGGTPETPALRIRLVARQYEDLDFHPLYTLVGAETTAVEDTFSKCFPSLDSLLDKAKDAAPEQADLTWMRAGTAMNGKGTRR